MYIKLNEIVIVMMIGFVVVLHGLECENLWQLELCSSNISTILKGMHGSTSMWWDTKSMRFKGPGGEFHQQEEIESWEMGLE